MKALASVGTFKHNIENLLNVNVPTDDNEELIV